MTGWRIKGEGVVVAGGTVWTDPYVFELIQPLEIRITFREKIRMLARTMTIREQNATRMAFFVPGFCMGAWAPLIPFVKLRLGIDDWALGTLLLCLGLGSMFTMPFAGVLAHRFGCRRVMLVSGIVVCAALLLLPITPNIASTAFTLFVFGGAIGAADCVANVQAVIVERASGRAMMSGFHGCFSVGGLVGAAGVALLLTSGFSVGTATLAAVALALIVTGMAVPGCLTYGGEAGQAFAIPRSAILLLGIFALIAALTEGAVLDWSAVFLSGTKAMAVEHAGAGYVVFALVMTFGRLFGDIVVNSLGSRKVIAIGAILSAAGLLIAVAAPTWHISLVGFALVGAGVSNLFPVLVSMCARQKIVPENIAVPAVLTLGYAGILMGPAIIGFLANFIALTGTFVILAIMLLGISITARRI
jgi:MFS family permease